MTESNDIQVKEQLNIRLVLDRSGSMSSCKEETVVSINEYINEIQKEAVEGVFTLSTFDNRSFDIPISRIPIRELTTLGEDILMPRGGTPLYDAIGTAVHDLSTFTHKENEKKVLVIVTDGYENASREYTSHAIKQLIEENRFKPLIARTYTLEGTPQAFKYVMKGQKIGNVVIKINH